MELPGDNNQETWQSYVGKNPFQRLVEASSHLVTQEVQDLMDWYQSRVDTLKEVKKRPSPMTDGKEWKSETNTEGQVVSIERADHTYWGLEGEETTIGDFVWFQTVKKGKEIPLPVKLFGKEVTMPLFGILVIVPDTERKFLMTVGQEATSDFHKKAMIRLPVQASQGKLDKVFNQGDNDADPGLRANLTAITQQENLGLKELIEYTLKNGEQSFYLPAGDTNFEYSHVVCVVWKPIEAGSELHQKLEAGGRNKFLSSRQIDFATMAALTNGHTDRALRMVEILSRSTPA